MYDVDFTKTFANMFGKESSRMLILLTVFRELTVLQIDINTAFLNGEIKTKTYEG
jgi:hypothetical protein